MLLGHRRSPRPRLSALTPPPRLRWLALAAARMRRAIASLCLVPHAHGALGKVAQEPQYIVAVGRLLLYLCSVLSINTETEPNEPIPNSLGSEFF
jgi:hypothetical protein